MTIMAPFSRCVIIGLILGVYILKHVPVAGDEYSRHPSETSDLSKRDINYKALSDENVSPEPNVSTENKRLKDSCSISVYNETRAYFSQNVVYKQYNFMYLKIRFFNHSNHSNHSIFYQPNATKGVITPFDWIWTYKGEGGAHQYLYLPGDFGYLSFGLLWSHTCIDQIDINLKTTGDCSDLQIGTNETDELIGHALGTMTATVASLHTKYNYSYWCYNHRMLISSDVLYHLCRNSICTFQTFEYRCCKYVIHINKTRTVECGNDHYHFGVLWWMFPIVVGEFLFAFYPILLTKFGMKFSEWSHTVKQRAKIPTNMSCMKRLTPQVSTDQDRKDFVTLKEHFPISFLATIFSPIYQWDCSGPVLSRILRLWLIICPIIISTTRVCLDYIYAGDLYKEAVAKGALVGFSSLIAGPDAASDAFLHRFNGPVTAITIFLVFSCTLVVFPKRLDECLEKGLPESSNQYMFLIRIPLKLRERFSGFSVRKHVGYKRLHQLLIAQTFMLLHWKFWRQALKLFCVRWSNVIFPVLSRGHKFVILAAILCILIFPIYVIFCVIELITSVIYFMFPVINSTFIVLKAFIIEYCALFQNRGMCLKFLRNITILPLIGLFMVSWYMYCLIFFDAFWFLSKIAMFTYSGIIAYPKLSYGYMILCLMSVYYMIESANSFGESYRDLLKVSIDVIRQIYEKRDNDQDCNATRVKDIVDKHGMNRDLFFHIVNRHRPRRNQVMITLLKFVSIITTLTISVELLITFDKFQDLSLVSHVFAVLFVCALPKMIRVLCTNRYQIQSKRILRAKIKRTFYMYLKHRGSSSSYVEDESVSPEYETVFGNDSDSDSIFYGAI